MTFKFKFNSVDGSHVEEYSDINEFTRDWTDGRLPDFGQGSFVTSDGITRIYPENEETKDAVVRISLIQNAEMSITGMNFSIERFMEGIGAPSRKSLAKLMADESLGLKSGNYIDTHQGRAFMVNTSDPMYAHFAPNKTSLENIGLNQGAMSLNDTFLIVDNLAKKAIIYDTRNEANSLSDMIQRSVEKNMTIHATDELREGFDDDGRYADVLIFGNEKNTQDVIKKIEDMMIGNEESIVYSSGGYNNTKDNPLSYGKFIDLAYKQNPALMVKKGEGGNIESTTPIRVLPVSKNLSNSAGCKEQGIYIDFNGKGSMFIAEGRFLKIQYSPEEKTRKVGSISSLDLQYYERVDENEIRPDIGISLSV
jgi:hypothetical protein